MYAVLLTGRNVFPCITLCTYSMQVTGEFGANFVTTWHNKGNKGKGK